MKYPNRLKEFRKMKGLTLEQVAVLMGKKCEDRLSEWERGLHMPNVTNLLKLSGIYGVSTNDIYK